MTQDLIMYLGRETLYTVILISGPLLLVSMLTGFLISIFQATTQIQEQTLSFVPKVVLIMVCLVVVGPWMINVLLTFTRNIYIIIPRLTGAG
jgi:flagellar biosynthetic protein FliQ